MAFSSWTFYQHFCNIYNLQLDIITIIYVYGMFLCCGLVCCSQSVERVDKDFVFLASMQDFNRGLSAIHTLCMMTFLSVSYML